MFPFQSKNVQCWLAGLAVALPLAAAAQAPALPTSSADDSFPIVELMPIVLKHEADLKLSPQQQSALADFRRDAMPKRVAAQQRIRQARVELRQAILDGVPEAQRQMLMDRWLQAEREHAEVRSRCADFLRSTLDAEQLAFVQQRYLQALR